MERKTKQSKLMSEGNQKEVILKVEDLMHMERIQAYVILQREGHVITELVEIKQ